MAGTQIIIDVAAQTLVAGKGPQFWMDVLVWAQESNSISPKEASIASTCARIPNKIPSEYQCAAAPKVLERIECEGFFSENAQKQVVSSFKFPESCHIQ